MSILFYLKVQLSLQYEISHRKDRKHEFSNLFFDTIKWKQHVNLENKSTHQALYRITGDYIEAWSDLSSEDKRAKIQHFRLIKTWSNLTMKIQLV